MPDLMTVLGFRPNNATRQYAELKVEENSRVWSIKYDGVQAENKELKKQVNALCKQRGAAVREHKRLKDDCYAMSRLLQPLIDSKCQKHSMIDDKMSQMLRQTWTLDEILEPLDPGVWF